jgi:uncharacterized membrane protein YeiH
MFASDLAQSAPRFTLPIYFTLAAYFTFGLAGALAGLRRGYDIVGISVIALISAGGGGLLRDGLLISSGPPSLLTDERYLAAIGVAALCALMFQRVVARLSKWIAVFDALGMGAFAVHGVQLSLDAGLSQPGAVLGGTITCVGGGLLRDILVRDEPLLFKPGQYYTLVAVGGCVLFLALLRWEVTTPDGCAWITIGATFLARILAIRFNWRTRALYREPEPSESGTSPDRVRPT